jgi:hypothetical protein
VPGMLNMTAVAPVKPVPLMVTTCPDAPLTGVKDVIVGVGIATAARVSDPMHPVAIQNTKSCLRTMSLSFSKTSRQTARKRPNADGTIRKFIVRSLSGVLNPDYSRSAQIASGCPPRLSTNRGS